MISASPRNGGNSGKLCGEFIRGRPMKWADLSEGAAQEEYSRAERKRRMKGPMTITEVAKKYDLTPDTLRYYERVGLLPNVKRTAGGRHP